MRILRTLAIGCGGLLWLYSVSGLAGDITLTSTDKRTTLIELYTSHGCSSCPPTEAWLNTFVNHAGLWTDIVPIAFHVDYWDYLGWKDAFSSKANSQRQHTYRRQNHIRSVYTPGVIVNGKEWRNLYKRRPMPKASHKAGVLKANLKDDRMHVSFSSENGGTASDALELNVAVLGFGINSIIKTGENEDRVLHGEFVSLSHTVYSSDSASWSLAIPKIERSGVKRYAIALWVNRLGDLTPLQAVGGWLD